MSIRFQSKLIAGAAATALLMGSLALPSLAQAYDGPTQEMQNNGGAHHKGKDRHHRREQRHAMKRMMKEADTNKDHALTQEEIDTYFNTKHKNGDTDGDGVLSLEEFKAIWMANKQRRMVRAFQRFDTDGDGKVTLGEFTEKTADIVERRDRNGDGKLDRSDRHGKRGHDRRHKDKADQ